MKKRLSIPFKALILGTLFFSMNVLFLFGKEDGHFSESEALESVIRQVKVHMLDERWLEALQGLNSIIEKFPESDQMEQAYFLKAKALSHIKGREEEAYQAYEDYISRYKSRGLSLWIEQAKIAKSALARSLYLSGQKHYLSLMLDSLDKESNTVKAYTALQIAKLRVKEASKKVLPVLINSYIQEKDPVIRNEYALAIISIDPAKLPTVTHGNKKQEEKDRGHTVRSGGTDFSRESPKWIILKIHSRNNKKENVHIKFPISFAKMFINSLPGKIREEMKNEMKKEGFDFDAFWDSLQNLEEKSLFRLEDDEEIIEIRIE